MTTSLSTKGRLMRYLGGLARLLIVVGGLNWGLVGLLKFDLVAWICGGLDFGQTNAASRIVYLLVGIAALYELALLPALFSGRETSRGRLAAH
ncbi:MAG TPA: DUF378 domain-containing protein [Microbacteriaceae bacterium]|nr:DUF378 domain-containing protein [Microbacteriaceae bacterium]